MKQKEGRVSYMKVTEKRLRDTTYQENAKRKKKCKTLVSNDAS